MPLLAETRLVHKRCNGSLTGARSKLDSVMVWKLRLCDAAAVSVGTRRRGSANGRRRRPDISQNFQAFFSNSKRPQAATCKLSHACHDAQTALDGPPNAASGILLSTAILKIACCGVKHDSGPSHVLLATSFLQSKLLQPV